MTLVLLVGERRIKMCGLGIGHARWKEGNVISFTWHPWSKCNPPPGQNVSVQRMHVRGGRERKFNSTFLFCSAAADWLAYL